MSQAITKFIRRHEVMARAGIRHTALYQRMDEGIFPKPIKIGPRAVAWLESEVEATLSAIARGTADEELRQVVTRLTESRKARGQGIELGEAA